MYAKTRRLSETFAVIDNLSKITHFYTYLYIYLPVLIWPLLENESTSPFAGKM